MCNNKVINSDSNQLWNSYEIAIEQNNTTDETAAKKILWWRRGQKRCVHSWKL